MSEPKVSDNGIVVSCRMGDETDEVPPRRDLPSSRLPKLVLDSESFIHKMGGRMCCLGGSGIPPLPLPLLIYNRYDLLTHELFFTVGRKYK